MIDYFEGPIIDVPEDDRPAHLRGRGRAVLLGLLLAADRGAARRRRQGFPGLRLRGDVTGTEHGLAMAPYIRESRRIRAVTTRRRAGPVAARCAATQGAVNYRDSVGVGMYRIDLHPSTGGDNYIDVASLPVRDPARRAAAAADEEPAAGRQEHRHHPHHQRLLPAAPGRVEHRRGGRPARRASASTTALTPHQVQADDARLWPTSRPGSTRERRRNSAGPTCGLLTTNDQRRQGGTS